MSAVSLSASPPRALDSTARLALASALDAEICGLHRRRNQNLARITARLAALRESLGYLSLGFASVQAYAKARVDWGSGKVKSLLELHGRLPRQPLLAAAFEAGEVDWSKAVLASRAVDKEPEREAYWLKAAQTLTSRALEAKVCGKTGETLRRGRWVELCAEDEAFVAEGLRALRAEGLELAPGAALAELIRRALQGGSAGSSRYRFLLSRCVDCERTTQFTGEEEVPISPAIADRLLCDAEVQDTRKKPARVSRTIPPSVKNEVQARSKGCCEAPGCAVRDHLEFHHLVGRGRGHDPDRILHLCWGHHRAPHTGALRLQGSWSTGVRFSRADGSVIGMIGGPQSSRDSKAEGDEAASRDSNAEDEGAAPVGVSARDKRDGILALVGLGLSLREATRRIEEALSAERSRGWNAGALAAAALQRSP
jgi:hypothetical protein